LTCGVIVDCSFQEARMHTRYLVAALALVAAAPAQADDTYSFEIGGRRIHITVPRNCDDISCISISLPGAREDARPGRPPQLPPLPSARPGDPRPPAGGAPSAIAPPSAPPPPAATAPPSAATPPPASSQATAPPAPPLPQTGSPPAPPPGAVASAPPAATVPAPPPTAAAAASPVGVWIAEKNEGRVRIEPCGQNLCGYVLQGSANGKQVLVDMKPTKDNQWSGKINDIRQGGVYQANMSLRTPNDLRVEGCAMGGMICGGQTWKRE
jgi:uncharacterized protein (DUF2147 family)